MFIIPQISEKAGRLNQSNQYVFKVPASARKVAIRQTLEQQYGVKIARVNIVRLPGKTRRTNRGVSETSGVKKAIVTLKPDSKKFEIVESI